MKQMRLSPEIETAIKLKPVDREIRLTEGQVLVTLTDVITADKFQNSHLKKLVGTFTRCVPTKIRVRDHYPHMAGNGWTNAETTSIWGRWRMRMHATWEIGTLNPYINKPSLFINEFMYGNFYSETEAGGRADNGCLEKEDVFWRAKDIDWNIGGKLTPYSMKYSTITPLMPLPEASNYYWDTVGNAYPYGDSPSSWFEATINQENKTWECDIELNQFWINNSEYYKQELNSYGRDPRLHFLEIQIQWTSGEETITGARPVYLWHLPNSFGNLPAPMLEKVTGTWIEPSGANICPLGLGFNGCNYDVGLTGMGGKLRVLTESVPLVYTEQALPVHQEFYLNSETNPDRFTVDFEITDIEQISELKAAIVYDEVVYEYIYDINKVSLENGFIVSEEFAWQRVPGWEAIPDDEEYQIGIYLIADFTDKERGGAINGWTNQTPGGTYLGEWCTKAPSCTQFCVGNLSGGASPSKYDGETPADDWTSGPKTIDFSMDRDYGTQIDQGSAYKSVSSGGVRPYLWATGSDGGRTEYWITMNLAFSRDDQGGVVQIPRIGSGPICSKITINDMEAIAHAPITIASYSRTYSEYEGTETLTGNHVALDWFNGITISRA